MNIIEWWGKYPEVIAVGQQNVTPKSIVILLKKETVIDEFPEEWSGFGITIKVEKKDGTEMMPPKESLLNCVSNNFEDIEF